MEKQSIQKIYQKHLQNIDIVVNYPEYVQSQNKSLIFTVKIKPYVHILNEPIQVQIKGKYLLQNNIKTNHDLSISQVVQMTDGNMIEHEQNIKNNLIIPEQPFIIDTELLQQRGQYFLQGSIMLYQLNQTTQQRLKQLQSDKQYIYPGYFNFPNNLPPSINHQIMDQIHIYILYQIVITFQEIQKDKNNKKKHVIKVPIQLLSPPKFYPVQILVGKQQIRCYHQKGTKPDPLFNSNIFKCVHYALPKCLLDRYIQSFRSFKSKYLYYDLYHVQVLANIHSSQSMLINVRVYRDPSNQQLISKRQKQKSIQFQQKNDVSIGSMKITQPSKTDTISAKQAHLTIMGQIQGLLQEPVCKIVISLFPSSYGMLEGETMFDIKKNIPYPFQTKNQLFTLRYFIKTNIIFQQQQSNLFDIHLVEQKNQDLNL